MYEAFIAHWPNVTTSAVVGLVLGFGVPFVIFRCIALTPGALHALKVHNATATALVQGLVVLIILAVWAYLTGELSVLLAPASELHGVVPRAYLLAVVCGVAGYGLWQRRSRRHARAL